MKEVQEEKNNNPEHVNNRAECQRIWRRIYIKAGMVYLKETLNRASIVMVAKGKLLITMGNNLIEAQEAEMFLVPPKCSYQVEVLEYTDVLACRFEVNMLSELNCPAIKLVISGKDVKEFNILKMNDALLEYQSQLRTYLNSNMKFAPLFEMKVHELFFLLAFYYDAEELAGFLAPVIDNATPFRDFVAQNWLKARNVEELARMANMSSSGFIKKFKKHFNESPYQWILNRKAKCVLSDIRTGSIPLKVIVDNYHFASYSHFCSFCKEQYGATPVSLRKTGKIR